MSKKSVEKCTKVTCLDFKQAVLTEPNNISDAMHEHRKRCSDCAEYHRSVLNTEAKLVQSLDVEIPSGLAARLELNQLDDTPQPWFQRFSVKAIGVAAVLILSVTVTLNQMSLNHQVQMDTQTLLAGLAEHMSDKPVTPVWSADRANKAANALLASYDGRVSLKFLENLQFSRLCPMGKYRGLHAVIETSEGKVEFAYVKGEPADDLMDVSYDGYSAQVKPVKGGNLVIFSQRKRALDIASKQLAEAMVWRT